MFIFATRLTRKKLFLAAGAAVVLICGVLAAVLGGGRAEAVNAEPPSAKNIKTAEERAGYLAAYGWEISPEGQSSQEVIIPREFDEGFGEYNEMQKEQGFDLAKYKGRRVMRYVYPVTNYPGETAEIRASLLMYKNRVIGGDVQALVPDGFMHGFAKPSAAAMPSGEIPPSAAPSAAPSA